MTLAALRLPSLVLGTTALISLAAASAASAQAESPAPPQRPSAAAPEKGSADQAHRTAGSSAKVESTTKVHGSAMTTARQRSTGAASQTTMRTTRVTTERKAGGTTVASRGHWVWRGGRQVWQSYGFTGGGYSSGPVATGAVYGGTYGVSGRSCWWYRHHDPADLPRWCPRYYGSSYGASYGYSAPSYRYGSSYSGTAYSYGYRYGATRTASTHVTSTRVATINSERFTSHAHGMAAPRGGAHAAGARTAQTGEHMRTHAQAGAQVKAPRVKTPSAAGEKRTQTTP